MSVMLYPCMLCVALLMCLFVLCVACLTVFVNCLVNKQFELLEFLSPFMLTCSMMRFLSLLLLGLCVCVVLVVLW